MAEHEWEKDELVWYLGFVGGMIPCWLAARITMTDVWGPWSCNRCGVMARPRGVVLDDIWVACDDLRRRDPAMEGKDKPTAESEAKR